MHDGLWQQTMKQDDILAQRKSILVEKYGTEGYFQLGNSPSLMLSVSISLSLPVSDSFAMRSVMPFLPSDLIQFAVKASPIMQEVVFMTIITHLSQFWRSVRSYLRVFHNKSVPRNWKSTNK